MINIEESDVMKQINKLNVTKSPGADGIHPRVLREIGSTISAPLTLLFKCSLRNGALPQYWRYDGDKCPWERITLSTCKFEKKSTLHPFLRRERNMW